MKLYDSTQKPPEQPVDSAPQPSEPRPLLCRFKNWWYYHKWYVICAIAVVWILGDIAGNALGLREKKPDFQIAYVGKTVLPDDTVAALEQAFAELGGDFNGDGESIVQVNQYVLSFQSSDPETSSLNYASEVLLMGDISVCDSYFFLTDDPGNLQKACQIFANPDGSCPDDSDVSAEGKVILWADCSDLANMDLGTYTVSAAGSEITGDNQELLSGLSLGRRCFHSDKSSDCRSQCDELWSRLCGTAKVQKGYDY